MANDPPVPLQSALDDIERYGTAFRDLMTCRTGFFGPLRIASGACDAPQKTFEDAKAKMDGSLGQLKTTKLSLPAP
jgi:hypothetical protein